MRKVLTAVSVGIVLTAIFAASSPAIANPDQGQRGPMACIGDGHSCTHDTDCCSKSCVNRTCK